MGILKNLSLLLLAVAVLGLAACKKQDADVTMVTVNDASGNAIEGVTIEYLMENEETTATTDSEGMAEVKADENTDIIAALDGYRPNKGTSNPGDELTISLEADDFNPSAFDNSGNTVEDPAFSANSLTPTLANWGTLSNAPSWATTTTYKGAVDPAAATAWYEGWTATARAIGNSSTTAALNVPNTTFTITDANIARSTDTIHWSNDTTYILDGLVYVPAGKILKIEEGTIIQAKETPSNSDAASALIVPQGAKIHAVGTANNPIIFTFEGDNGAETLTTRGRWGGLILLGNASLNSTGNNTNIEGIPSSETRGAYGGTNNNDNSGTLMYVSIRHGGQVIGADNEINGLTLGGVGSGTKLSYVEVFANDDDGIEWFGGTVNGDHLVVGYCQDDALDYDEGYRGNNQFVIVYQSQDDADRGGEHDGGTDPEDAQPYATPKFYNVTSWGNANSRAVTFRDNAGGEYHNSIFVGYQRGIDIEDLIGQEQDSYKQWLEGNLKIENNIFHNINSGNAASGSDLFKVSY